MFWLPSEFATFFVGTILSHFFTTDFGRGVAHQTVFYVACNSDSETMKAGNAPNSGSEAVCTSYVNTTTSIMLMTRVSYRCFRLDLSWFE